MIGKYLSINDGTVDTGTHSLKLLKPTLPIGFIMLTLYKYIFTSYHTT